ncbi:hypothetical protein [Microbacterium sp. NPDC089188]|uniref:hypothetical protein n=1 Tax=Microbacterium sp. NPDC089188 TaxID=3154971 RepID=UPI0034448CEF
MRQLAIPQIYLCGFATRDGRLWSFDLHTGRSLGIKADRATTKDHLYTAPTFWTEFFLYADAALREVVGQLDPADFSTPAPGVDPARVAEAARHHRPAPLYEASISDKIAGRTTVGGDPYANCDVLGDDPISSCGALKDAATEAVRAGDVATLISGLMLASTDSAASTRVKSPDAYPAVRAAPLISIGAMMVGCAVIGSPARG